MKLLEIANPVSDNSTKTSMNSNNNNNIDDNGGDDDEKATISLLTVKNCDYSR